MDLTLVKAHDARGRLVDRALGANAMLPSNDERATLLFDRHVEMNA